MDKKTKQLTLKIYDIIKAPLITEKTYQQQSLLNKYSFLVNPKATKTEIKHAFKHLFEVDVVDISTAQYEGKKKKMGRYEGRKNHFKKAIVSLKEGQTLEALNNLNNFAPTEVEKELKDNKDENSQETATEIKPVKKGKIKEVSDSSESKNEKLEAKESSKTEDKVKKEVKTKTVKKTSKEKK